MEKFALDERGVHKIKKFLTGGAAIGGGVGLSVALLNYLKDLYGDTGEDTSTDDDTLYVNMPAKKATVSGGVALTGGTLAAIGTAALVRKIYKELKKKELQDRLDQAQQGFEGALQSEVEAAKSAAEVPPQAGVPMHTGDMASSIPIALLLLTTLASGALTYRGLNKYFPGTKKPMDIRAKRVVVRRTPEEEEEKVASEDDGLELAIKLAAYACPGGDIDDLVHAVAQGRYEEVVSNLHGYGVSHALDMVKGASSKGADPADLSLAFSLCARSPSLRPTAEAMSFAELNDVAPAFTKLAVSLEPAQADAIIGVGCVLGAAYRQGFWSGREMPKNAALLAPLTGALDAGNPEDDAVDAPLVADAQAEHSAVNPGLDEAVRPGVQDADVEGQDEIDAVFGG